MTFLPTNFRASNSRSVPFPQASGIEIVIPCYNEEARLDLPAFLMQLDLEPGINFTFVNDGSADDTLAVLTSLHSARPDRVTIVSLERNSGKAEAVRQGLLHASESGAGLIGYWDADLATPLDAIADFARVMEKFPALTVVFGARRPLLGHRIERTLKRRAVSRICGALARLAIRLPIADTQCGAKLLRVSPELSDALAVPFSAGWLFDVELFARLSASVANRRQAFYEHPLAEWDEIPGSKVTTRAILRSGLQMLRLIATARLGLEARRNTSPSPLVRVLPRAETDIAREAA